MQPAKDPYYPYTQETWEAMLSAAQADSLPPVYTFSMDGQSATHFDGQPSCIKNPNNGVLYVLHRPVLHFERLTDVPRCKMNDFPSNWNPKTGQSWPLTTVKSWVPSHNPPSPQSSVIMSAMLALSDPKKIN